MLVLLQLENVYHFLFLHIFEKYLLRKKDWINQSYLLRREGLEPSRPKAVTGSLVLRVCQFRHPRD